MTPTCADCGAQDVPLVGLGVPPEFLCVECFELAIQRLAETLRRTRKARLN